MSEPVDPFELLRALNPVGPEDVTDAVSSTEARQTLHEIMATGVPARRPPLPRARLPRLHRRRYLLAAVPLVGALAAAAWALTQGPTKQLTIGCYASANLRARTVVVPAGTSSPTASCRRVWGAGTFGNTSTPPLQACVLPSGGIGVFPSARGTACQRLKLAPLTETATHTNPARTSPLALKNALVRKFLARTCVNEEQAMAIVRNEIRRLKLTNWHVLSSESFTSDRPCASLAFDEEQHRVLLIPVPK
jgi:hypothetical protein